MATIRDKWPWPVDVGLRGTFVDEAKQLRGRVEKNPDASPLADAAPAEFLNPVRQSERLRMGGPAVPLEVAESTTRALTHVIFRRILSKARRRGVVLFDDAVESADADELPRDRKEQMRLMLARERAMLELLDRYNSLAEDVYMRLLAGAKG